jgi:tRNA CCA-adding enzyme
MKKVNSVLKEVLEKINPPKHEIRVIENSLREFLEKFRKRIKTSRVNAEVFVGGSFAKSTVIKKDYYDVDVFVRFDKKYEDSEISNITKKLLKGIKNVSVIHGSRDYYRIKIGPSFFIEVVPVIKIKNPKEARNITDLSYSHVNYIKKKIKSKKILDEIRLAKALCYATNSYGAESYINGFSGYALELLVYRYNGFLNFLRAIVRIKDQEVVDIEKHHKSKQYVLMDINTSKLQSPIILIDPTFKHRNALAALSKDTFERFQKECRKFLKNPSAKAFEIKKLNLEKIKRDAKNKRYEFLLLETKTTKQEGDIAGSKLWKFHRHLISDIEKFFQIKNSGFEYNGKKSAKSFFVVKRKKEIIISGPRIKDKEHVKKFKKKYKKTFTKNKKLYVRQKITFTLKKFLSNWKNKHRKKIKDMSINRVVFL